MRLTREQAEELTKRLRATYADPVFDGDYAEDTRHIRDYLKSLGVKDDVAYDIFATVTGAAGYDQASAYLDRDRDLSDLDRLLEDAFEGTDWSSLGKPSGDPEALHRWLLDM